MKSNKPETFDKLEFMMLGAYFLLKKPQEIYAKALKEFDMFCQSQDEDTDYCQQQTVETNKRSYKKYTEEVEAKFKELSKIQLETIQKLYELKLKETHTLIPMEGVGVFKITKSKKKDKEEFNKIANNFPHSYKNNLEKDNKFTEEQVVIFGYLFVGDALYDFYKSSKAKAAGFDKDKIARIMYEILFDENDDFEVIVELIKEHLETAKTSNEFTDWLITLFVKDVENEESTTELGEYS